MEKIIRNATIILLIATGAILIASIALMAPGYPDNPPSPRASTPAVQLSEPDPADEPGSATVAAALVTDKGTPGPPKFDTRPIETPARMRVIEVVDRIAPTRWDVRKAVRWLDRYTGSRMVMVSRCTGKAWRCITFRTGDVKGDKVGYTSGNTITIDLIQANGAMNRYYKREANRTWLLTHELGHAFGLSHTGRYSKNVMNPYVNRYRMQLTVTQMAALAKR